MALGAAGWLRVSEATSTFAVLGAGSAVPRAGYGPAGYALELVPDGPVTLFDCGPGTIRALPSVGLDVTRVERVVLSHEHTDHVLDLFALAFVRRSPKLAPSFVPLEIVGPRGTKQLVARAPGAIGRWVGFEDTSVREVTPEEDGFGVTRLGDLDARFTRTGHTPVALAWRVEVPGFGGLVYSGDTGLEPRVGELARDAELFVVECSFPDGSGMSHHLTPTQVAELIRTSGAKRVLLTHFYPENDPEEAREIVARATGVPVVAARDGIRVRLDPDERELTFGD